MTTTVKSQNLTEPMSIEILIEAVSALDIDQKHKLADILDRQILEHEDEHYEESKETIAEIATAKAEYAAGDYVTYDEYVSSRKRERLALQLAQQALS